LLFPRHRAFSPVINIRADAPDRVRVASCSSRILADGGLLAGGVISVDLRLNTVFASLLRCYSERPVQRDRCRRQYPIATSPHPSRTIVAGSGTAVGANASASILTAVEPISVTCPVLVLMVMSVEFERETVSIPKSTPVLLKARAPIAKGSVSSRFATGATAGDVSPKSNGKLDEMPGSKRAEFFVLNASRDSVSTRPKTPKRA
jgi:hypothetical protein